ncbi:3-deoxy-manno-octulosonate cytidylyltransferase [Candidatus Pelagibacter sp.]|nr:3-deoxy-manno-octulosonate cytidylyltransferase [Candidatus Pelagibacter sp.]
MKTLIIIPSRLSASRLPGKPLLEINGISIVSHVFKKAVDANVGEVFVAAEDEEIVYDVKKNGGQAILTNNKHKTGTDRIYEALDKIGKPDIELVINLQGDEPLMNIEDIRTLHNKMIKTKSKLGTLASVIKDENLYKDQNAVKVETKKSLENSEFPEAINFMRLTVDHTKNIYHHLGIYCYQIETLKNFVSLNQSQNEIKKKLEQLRALDNKIKINVSLAKDSSIGVDTVEDFIAIKKIMEYKT